MNVFLLIVAEAELHPVVADPISRVVLRGRYLGIGLIAFVILGIAALIAYSWVRDKMDKNNQKNKQRGCQDAQDE